MTNKIIKGEVMSASNGGTTRRRISLLAGSSLVAAGLTAFGGLAPTTAMAQATCVATPTPAGNATNAVTIAAGTYNPGIACIYVGTGATVSTAGTITVSSTAGGNGVNLSATGADAINWVSTAGTVTGGAQTNGPVIDATSVSGPINITVAGITGTQTSVTHGVQAVSSGGGAVTVVNTAGNVNVTSTAGAQQAAIRAVSTGGNGAVTVTTGTGTVTGRIRGIQAQASGTGTLTVNASGAISTNTTAGVANIDATTGTGLLTINIISTGNTSSALNGNNGAAIRTSAGGDAVINVGVARALSSLAGSLGSLQLTAVGTTTVNNDGNITSATGGTTIRAAGGAFILNNREASAGSGGSITGRFDMSAVTGEVTVNNEPRASWDPTGASDFGPGDSTLANGGQVGVGASGGPTATFNGLETFDNTGEILFGTAMIQQIRTGVGQTLFAPGTDYIGSGEARLLMETTLGTAGQANCSVATVADCFSLIGGTTSGVTRIAITVDGDITTEANTAGIVLVDVTGGESHAGDFILDPETESYAGDSVYGAVIKTDGLLGFALLYDEDNQRHYLGSVVPGNRLEYVATLQEVVSIWTTTSDVVVGRQADLQNGGVGGFWIRAAGERTSRDVDFSFTASGVEFQEIDEYEMDTATAIGGFDLFRGSANGGDYVLGVHGGAVKSTLERASSATVDEMLGAVAGVYGAWWGESGLTLDGTINANFLKLDQDRPVEEVASTNVISFGARGEAGWKFAAGQGFYVQPLASVSYMRTDIEEVFQSGYDAAWEDVSSLRAGLGLRAGGDADLGGGRLGYWVTGRAWKELTNEGSLVLSTTAEDVVIHDDLPGEFQELGLGLSLSNSADTLRGFVSAGAKFADAADSVNASFGLRLRW